MKPRGILLVSMATIVSQPPPWIFKFSDFVQIFTFVPQIDGKTAFSAWNQGNRSNQL